MSDKDTITVDVLTVGRATMNGNIYHRDVLERAVNEYRAKMDGRRAFGQALAGSRVLLKGVSHMILDLKFEEREEGPQLVGVIKIIDTPQGKILRALHHENAVSWGPSGKGKVGSDGVVEDFEINHIAWSPKQ